MNIQKVAYCYCTVGAEIKMLAEQNQQMGTLVLGIVLCFSTDSSLSANHIDIPLCYCHFLASLLSWLYFVNARTNRLMNYSFLVIFLSKEFGNTEVLFFHFFFKIYQS